MKILLSIIALAISAVAITAISPSKAHAQANVPLYVSCQEYGTNFSTTSYPTDGGGVPGATHAFVCKNNNTSVQPSSSRTSTLYSAVSSGFGSNAFPGAVKSQLKSANVKYFFFNNRDEANNYFAHTGPYSNGLLNTIAPFVSTTSRCANTGYGWTATTAYIAVAVYNNCTLDQNTSPAVPISNPSLERTILHESGHAWDFTYGSLLNQVLGVRSQRTAFKNTVNYDVTNLTPSGFAGMSVQNKDKAVCDLFAPGNQPSALERDLAATAIGGPNGQVCTSSSPPVRYAPYSTNNKTPTEIAFEKIPYFITASGQQEHYTDSWAEIFVIEAFDTASPPAFLQMTDRVMGNTTVNPRAFNCTRAVMRAFINTLNPPVTLPAGCPTGSF